MSPDPTRPARFRYRRSVPADCTTCGTCCFSNLEPYVAVTGDDHARLGIDAGAYVAFVGNKAFMRMELGHCAALRVAGAHFTCAVYEGRPTACRKLKRNSAECAGELFAKGGRPHA